MDEKRIKQAENNFKNYLQEGKIKKVLSPVQLVYQTYLRNARESLKVANQLFQNKTSYLWVVVTSYYSMFYIAKCILCL